MSIDIAVLGATGAAGGHFLATLSESEIAVSALHPYGSPARAPSVDTVEFRGGQVGVQPLSRLGERKPDLAVLCLPPRVAAQIAPGLVARGVFVIDTGDATAGVLDAPLVVPGIHDALPEGVAAAGAVRCPSSPGWLLAMLLAPLRGRLTGASGVLSLSATARGKAGMTELGQQVVATLNSTDPPRRLFPDGLAFDTVLEDVPGDAWSPAEQLAATEVRALAGAEAAVSFAIQPLFAGMSVGLHLRGVDVDAAEAAWTGAPGLHAASRVTRLRPRAVTGKAGVLWGRLRADPAGDGVHVWAVADELAGAAGAVPLALVDWLLAAGLLGETG